MLIEESIFKLMTNHDKFVTRECGGNTTSVVQDNFHREAMNLEQPHKIGVSPELALQYVYQTYVDDWRTKMISHPSVSA